MLRGPNVVSVQTPPAVVSGVCVNRSAAWSLAPGAYGTTSAIATPIARFGVILRRRLTERTADTERGEALPEAPLGGKTGVRAVTAMRGIARRRYILR